MESKITRTRVQAYTVPTDAPEADGTFHWDKTTMILVELEAGGKTSLGYTYANTATAKFVQSLLKENVDGRDAWHHGAILADLRAAVRNMGETGVSAMAISAIDNSLWDLRARLVDLPLAQFIGQVRPGIAVYGSGGFTSYSDEQLTHQFSNWAREGFWMVKMKVGTHPHQDPHRVEVARKAIGPDVKLFTDANGAYSTKQALALADVFKEKGGVSWLEEPVSSDNLPGLHQVRAHAPAGFDIAAGEYGYTAWYFERMIDAGAIDVLQADATRCQGISGFLEVAALCWAHNVPLSAHCGPSQHLHVCCAVPRAIHMEFFHDHARIERMFFEGFCEPRQGVMYFDPNRPGIGLELKRKDAEKYAVS
jgi:L-alanine-DL-glutamate epimerase-like enolase superfamily enzyme